MQKSFFIKLLFHLSPLVPLLSAHYYFSAAMLLFVAIAYVKTFKLGAEIARYTNTAPDPSLLKAYRFWRSLTFLKTDSQT